MGAEASLGCLLESSGVTASAGDVGVPSETIGVSWHHSWQYFLDASVLEDWVEEKWQLMSSQDYGRDEAATIRLIKKHQVLCPEHYLCGLDWADAGPGEGVCLMPKGHILLLRDTEPCSCCLETSQPAPPHPPPNSCRAPAHPQQPPSSEATPLKSPSAFFHLCSN